MKQISTLVFIAVFLGGCNSPQPHVDVDKLTEELRNTDNAWNDMTAKDGFAKTIEVYYAEDVLLIHPNAQVQKGRAVLIKQMQDHPDTWNGLSWKVENAEVAQSGELGYTWGRWQQKYTTAAGVDTTEYGAYSDVWKKQADGKWKAIVDNVSTGPKPE